MNRESARIEQPVAFFVWVDSKMGGAERRFFRLFSHLCANGYNVHLFTSPEGVEALRSLGLAVAVNRIHVLPGAKLQSSRFSLWFALIKRISDLVTLIRRHNIRHLHFGGVPGANTFLYTFATARACPFSVSMVDPIKDYQQTVRRKFITIVTARFCTYIDCLSEQIKDDLCSFLGEKYVQKCLVSPCSFTDLKAARPGTHRDIDVSMIARMVPWKGHELLRNALLALGNRGRSGLVVHVCGTGPIETEVRRSFDAVKGQQIRIRFEASPFDILARSKVFVSLQYAENYPSQSLLEAMISKCAIIATDVGSTRQLLNESCAVLIPPNPDALANALQKLLDSETLRDNLGANAAKRVASTQTIERFAEYFLVEVFSTEAAR